MRKKRPFEKIAREIRVARKRVQLTQLEAAERIGINYRHYQDIEAGKVDLKYSTLERIYEKFKVLEEFSSISSFKTRSSEKLRAGYEVETRPSHIALLDESGNITYVNRSWREFAQKNELPASWLETANYFDVVQKAASAGECVSKNFAKQLQRVRRGELLEFELVYTCHSPSEKNWFRMTFSQLPQENGVAYLVAHTLVTPLELPWPEEAGASPKERSLSL